VVSAADLSGRGRPARRTRRTRPCPRGRRTPTSRAPPEPVGRGHEHRGSPGRRGVTTGSSIAPVTPHLGEHLAHRDPGATADVVDLGGGTGLGTCGGDDVGFGQVAHVDVVADAGAIRGRVVVTEHLRGQTSAHRAHRQGDEIVGAGVAEVVAAGADDIEVAQCYPRDAMRRRHIREHPLSDDLRPAVGAGREQRRRLVHQRDVLLAVDSGRGRVHDVAHAGRDHGVEQGAHAVDVLAVVEQRLLDGLPPRLLGGQVHDPGDAVLAHRRSDGAAVEHRALDESHAGRDLARTPVLRSSRRPPAPDACSARSTSLDTRHRR
jgi:hypothetical protein